MKSPEEIERATRRNQLAHQVVADLLAANDATSERHCIRCIQQAITAAQEYERLSTGCDETGDRDDDRETDQT